MAIIIIISINLLTVCSADDNIYEDSNAIGYIKGQKFSFLKNVGPNYPKSISYYCSDYIHCIGFRYEDKFISEGNINANIKTYQFQDNEFINEMEMCIKQPNILYFLGFRTNKNVSFSCGTKRTPYKCKTFNHSGYAIAGFYGYSDGYIRQLGIIYHKIYNNCTNLESEQFCSYDHSEIFLTTDQKIIDKCYPSCKKCINYGNDNNHNCTECFPGFELLDEPGFEFNCYKHCLNYNFDKNTLKYECTGEKFTLLNETTNVTQNEIIDSFDEIIKNKKPSSSYIINGSDYTVFINPIGRYLKESKVNIDFSECEKKLREKFPTFIFRIVQINSKNSNPYCLNEDVEYKVYNQFGEVVDLSCCNDVKITIQNKISKELFDLDKIQNFLNKGIDIFNLKDDFFNDICYPYSDENSDSDMTLKDRVSNIYLNYSLCGKECEKYLINDNLTYVNCSCDVKQDISKEEKEGNFKTFLKPFLYSNFGVIRCYNLVFSIAGKLKNIGFWIFGIFILFRIPIYYYYFLNTINPIKKYINGEMMKYEYIQVKENENPSKTFGNSTEENLRQKNINKMSKSKKKFHRLKKSKLFSRYKIINKSTIQTISEHELNNENDKVSSKIKKS